MVVWVAKLSSSVLVVFWGEVVTLPPKAWKWPSQLTLSECRTTGTSAWAYVLLKVKAEVTEVVGGGRGNVRVWHPVGIVGVGEAGLGGRLPQQVLHRDD